MATPDLRAVAPQSQPGGCDGGCVAISRLEALCRNDDARNILRPQRTAGGSQLFEDRRRQFAWFEYRLALTEASRSLHLAVIAKQTKHAVYGEPIDFNPVKKAAARPNKVGSAF